MFSAHSRLRKRKAAYALVLEIAERFLYAWELLPTAQGYAEAHRLGVRLLIDSSGTGTLFGSAESYAERLYRELRASGFPAGIGAAPNAQAALMLARSGPKVVCANRDSVRGNYRRLRDEVSLS